MPEELLEITDQVAEGEALPRTEALRLMELSEMRSVDGLVPEHTINRKTPGF